MGVLVWSNLPGTAERVFEEEEEEEGESERENRARLVGERRLSLLQGE